MANYHLVILKKPYLDAILAGRKTIESRFTKTRSYAFEQVRPGDRLFLKESSGTVCARATVAAVERFDNLTPDKIEQIRRKYNHHIMANDEYWQSKMSCNFGLLVWLTDVRPIKPVRINKKDWRAWVLLTAKENFGLLSFDAEKTAP